MIRSWLAAHKSIAATVTSGSLIAALVAGVAIVSDGYSAQRLDLNDGTVWVSSSAQQAIGRANTAILELNTVVPGESAAIDVVHSGETVLLFDRGNNRVDIVNAATSEIDKSVPVPPTNPDVFLAGDRAVVISQETGEVWLMASSDFENFDAGTEPTLSFGADSVASVDANGTLFAYSPDAGELYRVETASGDSVGQVRSVTFEDAEAGDYQVTSVGDRPAVYDAQTRQLDFDGRRIDLSGDIPEDGRSVLQQASATGDALLVAHAGGLVSVPVGGAAPEQVTSDPTGTPAAPVTIDGCDYAAWSDGTAWQRCGSTSNGTAATLGAMPATAQLVYRVNNDRVVLNDANGGASWAVQHDNALIDNWDELIERDRDREVVEENDIDSPPEFEKTQVPPIAVDDELGARPGRANVLPVLLNDYDPNGDVLIIDEVTELDEALGRIDLINDRQQLQLTLAPDATGPISFDYTVNDGRGGSATATVTVTVRGADENSAPQQVRATADVVQSGGRLTTQVLGDWYDPDADAFYLARSTVPSSDSVTWKPEGTVVFNDSGEGGETKTVSLVVSDGLVEGTGSLSITVRSAGDVPVVAEPFVVLANAGAEVTVSPLVHVHGGSGAIRLTSVPATAGSDTITDYDGGTFRFVSSEVRTHYLEYTVTDGNQTATGSVRVVVSAPPEANTRPITVTHTAFIRELSTQNVDVLATDIDPGGGVLLVTGVSDVPPESGVLVEILDQRLLRVTLTRPLEGPVAFSYRVSNGLAEADGTVTVVEIPEPAIKQAPVAVADSVSVRVGDAIDIPVLENDSQPDGDPLSLNPVLTEELPSGAGLLFVAEDTLRYLAPDKTGNFTAVYRVEAPDGQWATAAVTIAVREVDAASNTPPVPRTVTARVLAGERVRINIPLDGIDPDGDSVQLRGQETNPEKGAVTEVGSDWIEYEAGQYSAGTDTFTYAVRDALGARAIGTVRIGIGQRMDGARNPIAIADEVTVRPERTVSVQVLANDSDPDGGVLTITGVEPTVPGPLAEIDNDVIRVDAPPEPGRYGFVYDIENARGGTSSNFLTVIVSEDAPLSRPVANDTVLTLSDILGRETVDVNALANVFFADGSVAELVLEVQPGYGGNAEVTSGNRIRVTLADEQQIIPFKVTHPDDPSVFAFAFVWVPGFADARPQLKRGAERLTVESESVLSIDLNEYVVAVGGREVRLTDANSVRATHADGSDLVTDEHTLRFRSEDKYFGPASISFEVTDGVTANDPNGRTATLVLPIDVLPRENQPPAFNGAVLEFEPAQEKVIDLLRLTNYPYTDDQDELEYSVLGDAPAGFSYLIEGQQLTITADAQAPRGTRSSLTIGVRDALNEGQAGRIELRVVPSTRPIAQPALDDAVAPRNSTTVVDVLQNDRATNPFPGSPLRVVDVRGVDSSSLPAGVTVVPSADRSTLSVTVDGTVEPSDVSVQYQVMDATNDPLRTAWGTVRISIQDRPDPVTNLRTTGFGDRRVTVAFDAGAFNNSPIQGYEVQALRDGAVVSTRVCESTTCDVATDGNGPDRRVRIQVSAVNAIGASDPIGLDGVWSDVIPAAPANVRAEPLDRGLRVFWDAADTRSGSAITSYVVAVGGVVREVPAGSGSVEIRGSFDNGSAVRYSVSARNSAQVTSADVWNTAVREGTPLGKPRVVGTPAPTPSNDDAGTVTLAWQPFAGEGRDGIRYFAAAYSGGEAPSCTVPTEGRSPWAAEVSRAVPADTSTGHTFTGLAANVEYRFAVLAANSQGCTLVTEIRPVTPRVAPSGVTATVTPAAGGDLSASGGVSRPVLSDVGYTSGGGSPARQIFYRLSGTQTGTPIEEGESLTLVPIGEAASIEVRVVETHGDGTRLESPWSAPIAAGVAVSTVVSGMQFVPIEEPVEGDLSGTFQWTDSPAGGGYAAVEYSLDDGLTWIAMAGAGESAPAGGPGVEAVLLVRVTANDVSYTQQYRGN